MRLLLVVDGYYPGIGGTESQVALLSRLFRERGHDVRVVAPRLDPSRPLEENWEGTRITRIDYPKVRGVGAIILMLRFMTFLLRERGNFDALHIHMTKNLAAAAGAVRPWLGKTVALKVSGAWEFDGGVLDPSLKWHPVYATLRILMQRNDVFQAISSETVRKLEAAGIPAEKVRDIPNAVDMTLYRERIPSPDGKLRVIYTGRLTPVKGVDVLLQAWRMLPDRTGLTLILVGEGEQRRDLEAYVEQEGMAGDVQFLGWQSDIPTMLCRADVYVQPSLNEGLPNSVLEAMASGLPVVATRISGNEDLVVESVNGYLCKPGDATDLAVALQRAIDGHGLLESMGQASREIIRRRYGADQVIRRLEAVYRGEPEPSEA